MVIFDVFPFSHELDLLELRLNLLSPHVDYFVISEATTTFSGLQKPLRFKENQKFFQEFDKKIIHISITDEFEGTTFERDRFQKDRIKATLAEKCAGNDLIIFSDLDEIPDPRKLDEAFRVAKRGKMGHFAQDHFLYYLNLMDTSGNFPSITGDYPGLFPRKWLGARVMTFDYLRSESMTDLRDPKHKSDGSRIENGGWHFSFCGGLPNTSTEERIARKIMDTPHQELVNSKTLNRISKRLKKRKDPFGRRGLKLRRVPVDERYPEYLRVNQSKYSHMIMSAPDDASV